MVKTFIEAPIGAKYISEIPELNNDLPHNCILSKITTGSGGTTLAISAKENYVICVPFISLIENKVAQHNNIFPVYGKFKVNEFKAYLRDPNVQYKKIMVTYDSLPKLLDLINPEDYRLLIDEYHLVFQSICFRNKAVYAVLENYLKFKSFCFMTATLVEQEFILKELIDVPVVEIKWSNIQEVTVTSIRCKNDVIHATVELINSFLRGDIVGNAHIFVNSVTFMKDIVKACKLTNDNARTVYSDNNMMKTGLLRSKPTGAAKKINLYSSVSFQGVDIYDEDGKSYVISDKSKSSSLLDISTSFTQIVNRVRDSKYKDEITHIYTSTRYDIDMTYDEYKEHLTQEIEADKGIVKEYNGLSVRAQSKIIDGFTFKSIEKCNTSSFVIYDEEDKEFVFDENLVKYDMYNFKVTKHIYKLTYNVDALESKNLREEYENKGFNVREEESNTRIKGIAKTSPKETFRETVLECKLNDKDFYNWACQKYSFLEEALNVLGYEGIENLDYHINNIKKHLLSKSGKDLATQALITLRDSSYFTEGKFYTHDQIKSIVKKVYEEYNLTNIPTSSIISKFYNTLTTTIKYEGRKVGGYKILNKKR